MNLSRKSGITVTIGLSLLLLSCGDTFRPIATPIVQPGGDPQRLGRAVVFNDNGPNLGSVTILNVSGDTNMGAVQVGRNPVHGATLSVTAAYTVNRSDSNTTNVTITSPATPTLTVPLPVAADPVFAVVRLPRLYIAERGLDRVGVISLESNVLETEIPLPAGAAPVAMALGQVAQKIYVANQGNGTVTVIQAVDNVVLGTITVGTSPVWIVGATDGTLVFVANQGSNDVSVIDTATDTVVTTIPLGVAPDYLFYDRSLERVYTVNRAANSISIIRADQPLPAVPSLLATVSTTGAGCGAAEPVSVTALTDRSRAYVAMAQVFPAPPGGNPFSLACVLNTGSNAFVKAINVGYRAAWIASSSDATKVYVANEGDGTTANPGSTSIIRTSDDTVVTAILAPKVDPTCVNPAPPAPPTCSELRQSPRFILTVPQ